MTALIRIDRTWTTEGQDARSKPIRFCSRCGHPAEEPPRRPQRVLGDRVCPRCGMGMMLSCSREALPGTAAAFAVVRFDLRISAVSQAAEVVLGHEDQLVERPLLEVFTSPLGDDQLARRVARAAQRPADPVVMPVRLVDGPPRGVGTLAARIATCGPPRAALLTVEQSEFGRR